MGFLLSIATSELSVVLLCELVVGGSFLASNEAGEAELFAGFHHGGAPLTESALLEVLLGLGALFLGNDFAVFVQAEVLLDEATTGAVGGTAPNLSERTDSGFTGFACAAGDSFAGNSAGGSSSFGRPGHSCPAGCCPAGGSLDGSTSDGHFLCLLLRCEG